MNEEDLTGRSYRHRTMVELEQLMVESLTGNSYSRESHFRRNALPILSGLLNNTFDEDVWMNLVGSPHVAYDVYSDDGEELLFTLPPLMYVGSSLIGSDDQPSLTEETGQLIRQAGGANLLSDEAVGQLVYKTVQAIGDATYASAVIRAKNTIDTLNGIFRRYGLTGQIEYPEGLLAAHAVAMNEQPASATAENVAPQPQPPLLRALLLMAEKIYNLPPCLAGWRRFLVFGDVHLLHGRVPTAHIVNILTEKIIEAGRISAIYIVGDLWDDSRYLRTEDSKVAIAFIVWLLNYCKVQGIALRVLEGTPSHDHKQSEMIVNMNATIGADAMYLNEVGVMYDPAIDAVIGWVQDEYRIDATETERIMDEKMLSGVTTNWTFVSCMACSNSSHQ